MGPEGGSGGGNAVTAVRALMFRPVPRPNAPRAPPTSALTYWLTRTTDRIWAVRFEGLQIKDLTLSFLSFCWIKDLTLSF